MLRPATRDVKCSGPHHILVGYTHNDSVPLDSMEGRLLLHDRALALETTAFLAEAAFQNSVRSEDLDIAFNALYQKS